MKRANVIAPTSAFGSAYVSKLDMSTTRVASSARNKALEPVKAAKGLADIDRGRRTIHGLGVRDESARYERERLRRLP